MKCYVPNENVPMSFHRFICYVTMPLRILAGIYGVISSIYWMGKAVEMGKVPDYGIILAAGWVDVLFAVALVILAVVSMVMLLRMKWLGVTAFWGAYGLAFLKVVVCVGFAMANDKLFGSAALAGMGDLLLSSIYFIIVFTYYRKRRLLFTPAPANFDALLQDAVLPEDGDQAAEATTVPEAVVAGPHYTMQGVAGRTQEAAAALPSEILEAVEVQECHGSSVDLLMQIQAEEMAMRAGAELTAQETPIRRSGAPMWLTVSLGVLCLVLMVAMGVMGWQGSQAEKKADELSAQVETLNSQIETLNDSLAWRMTLFTNSNEKNKKLEEKIERARAELNFWLKYGCIVVEGNSYYHDNTCKNIAGKDFWIYNVESAQAYGHSPCPICEPNEFRDVYDILEGNT